MITSTLAEAATSSGLATLSSYVGLLSPILIIVSGLIFYRPKREKLESETDVNRAHARSALNDDAMEVWEKINESAQASLTRSIASDERATRAESRADAAWVEVRAARKEMAGIYLAYDSLDRWAVAAQAHAATPPEKALPPRPSTSFLSQPQ